MERVSPGERRREGEERLERQECVGKVRRTRLATPLAAMKTVLVPGGHWPGFSGGTGQYVVGPPLLMKKCVPWASIGWKWMEEVECTAMRPKGRFVADGWLAEDAVTILVKVVELVVQLSVGS